MRYLTTFNLAELAFLLQRKHKLKDVSIIEGVYGVAETAFSLEGRDIDLDHHCFFRENNVTMNQLISAVETVLDFLYQKREAQL